MTKKGVGSKCALCLHRVINRNENKSNPVVSLDSAATQYRDLRVLSSDIYNVEKERFYDFDSSNTREKQ